MNIALYGLKNNLLEHIIKQKDFCSVRENKFKTNALIELHHVLNEKSKRTSELQWVHAHCDDQIHS